MGVRCFMLEPGDRVRRYFRRYTESRSWTCAEGWHWAEAALDTVPALFEPHGQYRVLSGDLITQDRPAKDDPRWPTQCATGCGHVLTASNRSTIRIELEYRRVDTGEIVTLRDAPPGAIWNAWWLAGIPEYTGPDGQALYCRLPDGHDWHIDGPCSNCTKKDEKPRVHKCWVRHGTPPNLTVDKDGVTCSAGAGSILSPRPGNWHGFLRAGELVQ